MTVYVPQRYERRRDLPATLDDESRAVACEGCGREVLHGARMSDGAPSLFEVEPPHWEHECLEGVGA